jgi:amicyanin
VAHPSNRTLVLATLAVLLCAVTVGYVANRGGGGTGVAKATVVSDPPAPPASPTASPQMAANQVVIDNFKFEPRRLTVKAGTKVTWINRDDVPHTATSTAKPRAFDSKTLDTDGQFSHTFSAPGTYEYFCAVHPHMKGEIVVK